MLGAIIGDIIGSTYEFDNTKDYNFELFPTAKNTASKNEREVIDFSLTSQLKH